MGIAVKGLNIELSGERPEGVRCLDHPVSFEGQKGGRVIPSEPSRRDINALNDERCDALSCGPRWSRDFFL